MERELRNSPLVSRLCPSAMLLDIETEARRSWLVRPKISSFGNDRVNV